ncbi:hypothetical protein J0B03_05530 [Alkalibacter rhizosphaerae]|uniref:Uncharacterized protein n=1 Tax=Alkalibacter rhizosphaerae TaxID=2815577 RepID=A0A974XGN7_9FIRM|nr:hypothetical protein [Alkalibacter rhizosphaerae]QSX09524.1 hypothetical protein J0B03_05530 [Alkalibacter rhizosphaerae]
MSEELNRLNLYEEVWSDPIMIVAKRYGISDNGLRKRCTVLNIPLPPRGYWAKLKAGKPVPERTPLPNFIEEGKLLSLIYTEEISLDQLKEMKGFDILTPNSIELLSDWCKKILVPKQIEVFHALVLKHQAEMEYRIIRDQEYPHGARLHKPFAKVKFRKNEPTIPIRVSKNQSKRAYKIVDTVLKAFMDLNAGISVERGDFDNITISLLKSSLSFEFVEHKTKLRDLGHEDKSQDLIPLYQKVYDGKFSISWIVRRSRLSGSDKAEPHNISFSEMGGLSLENQLPTMIYDLCKLCCNDEIVYRVKEKEEDLSYEKQKRELREKEIAEQQRKIIEMKQGYIDSLVNEMPVHANNWFEYNKLMRFADELEDYLKTLRDEENIQFLIQYIRLVRENAVKFRPIDKIVEAMKLIEK